MACVRFSSGNKKGLESQDLSSNLWCPGETRTKRYMLRFLWGGVLCGFLSTHKSTHYFFCAYQNTNFGEVRKRFPPSFGFGWSVEFLPTPSRRTKIVAVNAWKVPPVARVSGRCCFLPTPPRLRAVRLAGFAVPVPCRAAASVGEVSRATRNRKRAAQESPVHSPASGSELPAMGHPSGSTFWGGGCQA